MRIYDTNQEYDRQMVMGEEVVLAIEAKDLEKERDALREKVKGLYNCRLEPDKLLCMLEWYHKEATHEP